MIIKDMKSNSLRKKCNKMNHLAASASENLLHPSNGFSGTSENLLHPSNDFSGASEWLLHPRNAFSDKKYNLNTSITLKF